MEGLEHINSEEELVVSDAMIEIRKHIDRHFSSAWASPIDRGRNEIAVKVEAQVKHFVVKEINSHLWWHTVLLQWQKRP